MSDDDELTPEEKMAFTKLPREAAPSRLLEERIVRTLREDGLLVPVSRRPRDGAGARVRPWIVAAASMAASLVLFGSGVLLGQWTGTRSAERALLAIREQDNALVAQRVQAAGTAYVRALAALIALRDSPAAGQQGVHAVPSARVASEIQQGGEAAWGALYAAALELSRLTPGDPDAGEILQILEERRFAPPERTGTTKTVWY